MTTSQIMRVEIQQRPPDDLLPDEDELPADAGASYRCDDRRGRCRRGSCRPCCRRRGKGRAGPRSQAIPRTWGKVGRNEPCPCGSGKKYKHCHGAFA